MGKILKIVGYCVVLLMVVFASVFATEHFYLPIKNIVQNGVVEQNVEISGKTIEHGLKEIAKLDTAEYHYTHVEVYDSDKKVGGVTLPLTSTKVIYSYDGVITAGIDFSAIEASKKGKTITVKLPNATISGSTIDENSFMLYDERNSVFNPYGMQNLNATFINMKQEEEDNAIEKGLLTWASDNAKTLIENLLKSTYNLEEYEIVFE